MCGICGAIATGNTENTSAYAESLIRRMLSALRHRGPDDEGILSAPPVSMGMRRLSIIDLPGGNQPIWNESNTLALVKVNIAAHLPRAGPLKYPSIFGSLSRARVATISQGGKDENMKRAFLSSTLSRLCAIRQ